MAQKLWSKQLASDHTVGKTKDKYESRKQQGISKNWRNVLGQTLSFSIKLDSKSERGHGR